MSNYEKVTASPEVLGAFLSSLPVATGPWDESFHEEFCNSCKGKNCDGDGKKCPHQDKRNNPTWWLRLGEKPGEAAGLAIRVNAAFPIHWDQEYYTVAARKKDQRPPCICCDGAKIVKIKGAEYECPRCKGTGREKEATGETTIYSVAKWKLASVNARSQTGILLTFEQVNSTERYGGSLEVRAADFHDMRITSYTGSKTKG